MRWFCSSLLQFSLRFGKQNGKLFASEKNTERSTSVFCFRRFFSSLIGCSLRFREQNNKRFGCWEDYKTQRLGFLFSLVLFFFNRFALRFGNRTENSLATGKNTEHSVSDVCLRRFCFSLISSSHRFGKQNGKLFAAGDLKNSVFLIAACAGFLLSDRFSLCFGARVRPSLRRAGAAGSAAPTSGGSPTCRNI